MHWFFISCFLSVDFSIEGQEKVGMDWIAEVKKKRVSV